MIKNQTKQHKPLYHILVVPIQCTHLLQWQSRRREYGNEPTLYNLSLHWVIKKLALNRKVMYQGTSQNAIKNRNTSNKYVQVWDNC